MKMRVLKKFSPIFVIGLVCVFIFTLNRLNAVDAADESPYFLSLDGQNPVTGSIDLTSAGTTLQLITKDNNLGNAYTIEWQGITGGYATYTETNVPALNVKQAYKVMPLKVGVDEVFVNIRENTPQGSTSAPLYVLSLKIKSNLYLNNNALKSYNNEDLKYLVVDDTATFADIKQAVIFNDKTLDTYTDSNPATNPTSTVTWYSDNPDVISNNNNTLSVKGSGVSTITATAPGDIKVKYKVLVKPKFAKGTASGTNWVVDPASWNKAINFYSEQSFYKLFTNAEANSLNWAVYDYKTGAKTTKLSISSPGKETMLSTAKAGKYDIYGTTLEASLLEDSLANTETKFQDTTNVVRNNSYAKATVTVPINANNETIVMNKGDSYNIYSRTNAPSDLDLAPDNTYDGNIVGYNPNNKTFTATGEGETTVTITTASTYLLNGTTITEGAKQFTLHFVVTDGLTLNTTDTKMYTGATLNLIPSILDGITWTSSDPTVATVDNKGKVTAAKKGFTIITASKIVNGVERKATCRINVLNAVTDVKVEPNAASLDIGKYLTVYAKITPSETLDEDVNIRWFTSDSTVVSIEANQDGNKTAVIKGLKTGTATVTAVDTNNVVLGSTLITVNAQVDKITLSHSTISTTLSTGSTQLVAYLSPDNASDKRVTWTSSDTSVATVSANGLVTFLKPGKVAIIATSTANPAVTAMCNIDITVPVTGLTLDSTTKSLAVGKSERITYTILPTNATNNVVTWVSTNPAVATVSSTGYVTGVAVGQTVIIARTADGNILQYCTVNVTTKPSGIVLDKTELTMNKDDYMFLYATLTPANASENAVTWSTTDEKVVNVTQSGKVTAKESGTALVIARDASGNSAYCKITVVEKVKSIKLNFSKKTLKKGNTFKLKATFNPTSASNKGIIWSTSSKTVASVASDGTVKGLKGGVAVITAKSKDGGHVATCIVTVYEKVTSIKLNHTNYKLGKGSYVTLRATVLNSSATNKKVRWKSSNSKVATVNSNGVVKGKKLGYATITAYATDGSKVHASCRIRVVTEVSSVRLNRTSITLVEGRSTKLKATISPRTATYKAPQWSSSKSSVAAVSSSGTVTGLKEGTTIITVKAKDNSGRKATCFVNVIKAVPATSVTIISADTMLVVGESAVLHRTVSPANTTDVTRWYSDDKSIVTVNSKTGKVTAKKPGIASVTCTAGGKASTIKVTVVGLSRTNITLEQYSTYTLTVYGVTSGINWDVANPEVCRIDSTGKITSARVGSTIITATVNGKKLYCRVTVVPIK